MNNIRKIIEERLENARNERDKCEKYRDLFASIRVAGNIQICQELLNLIPAPRTEQEILKDFEKLGWEVSLHEENNHIILKKERVEKYFYEATSKAVYYINIDCVNKTFEAERIFCFSTMGYKMPLHEYKLLNELFEVIF